MDCRGVVTVDTSTSPATITYNVEYYSLGHLAKFVVPGAHRIDSTNSGSGGVENGAVEKPDGSIVLFVLDSSMAAGPLPGNWSKTLFKYTLPAASPGTF